MSPLWGSVSSDVKLSKNGLVDIWGPLTSFHPTLLLAKFLWLIELTEPFVAHCVCHWEKLVLKGIQHMANWPCQLGGHFSDPVTSRMNINACLLPNRLFHYRKKNNMEHQINIHFCLDNIQINELKNRWGTFLCNIYVIKNWGRKCL